MLTVLHRWVCCCSFVLAIVMSSQADAQTGDEKSSLQTTTTTSTLSVFTGLPVPRPDLLKYSPEEIEAAYKGKRMPEAIAMYLVIASGGQLDGFRIAVQPGQAAQLKVEMVPLGLGQIVPVRVHRQLLSQPCVDGRGAAGRENRQRTAEHRLEEPHERVSRLHDALVAVSFVALVLLILRDGLGHGQLPRVLIGGLAG